MNEYLHIAHQLTYMYTIYISKQCYLCINRLLLNHDIIVFGFKAVNLSNLF